MSKSKAITKAIPHYRNEFGDVCYICPLCQMEYDLEHDKPYIINGDMRHWNDREIIHKHKNESEKEKDKIRIIDRYVCPYCACKLGNWSAI